VKYGDGIPLSSAARRTIDLWLGRTVGGVFLLLGPVIFAATSSSLLEGCSSHGWPTVEGQVVSSSVNCRCKPAEPGTIVSYQYSDVAIVRYEYAVDGHRYSGDRVQIGATIRRLHTDAQADASRYPVGKLTTVYYDPTAPARSVLEPGATDEQGVLAVVFSAVISMLGAAILVVFGRRRSIAAGASQSPPATPHGDA
jgi:hypothetical protein